MATSARGRITPVHLWIVGTLATIWNAFGCYDYCMSESHNEKYLSMYGASSSEVIAYLGGFPAWAVAGWALGVWAGLAGSLLLLARSRFAVVSYALSLLGLILLTIYQRAMATPPASLQKVSMTVMDLVIWAVALFLLYYSWSMEKRGTLR